MLYTGLLVGYSLPIVVAFIVLPKVKRNNAFFASCIVLVSAFLVLAYCRPTFFRDTAAYELSYDQLQWDYLKGIDLLAKEPNTYMEYGFVFIELVFKSLGVPFRLFSALISLFYISSVYYWCNSCCEYLSGDCPAGKHFLAFFSIFLPYFGLFYNFVAIRSALSFAFLAIATSFALRKQRGRTLLFLLIAFSVQRLSIISSIPLMVLLLEKIQIKKSQFLVLWVVLSVAFVFERSTHLLISSVGMLIQNLYNTVMHTGIYLGFDNNQTDSITSLLQCCIYIGNGMVYYLNWQEDKRYGAFSIIYLLMMSALAITCAYAGFYRIVDYLYFFSVPVNYVCSIHWKRSSPSRTVCLLFIMSMSILLCGKNFLYWYLFD